MKFCFVPFILIAPVVGLAGCGVPVPAAQKSAPPAKVAQPAKEAELATGPKPGAMVVTDGAAELFGTEFGFGK